MPDLVLLTQMLVPPVAETEAPSQLDDPVDTPLLSEGKCVVEMIDVANLFYFMFAVA